MFKKIIFLIICMCHTCFMANAQGRVQMPSDATEKGVHIYAHRGAWTRDSSKVFIIPENSLASVKEAARLGFEGIEVDVKYTKDKKLVIMHDSKLNRTVRLKDGYQKLSVPLKPGDLTLKELRRDYVLASTDPSQRAKVPTLKEILLACKRYNLIPMLHSAIPESYELAQKILGDKWVCFTSNLQMCKEARKISGCLILYSISSGPAEDVIKTLQDIGGPCGISSMKYNLYSSDFIAKFTEAGYQVQASIFPLKEEYKALDNGITFILTDHLQPIK